ncbi:hypothetical protein As57867_004535, partial [Aphanomyces stellatus]
MSWSVVAATAALLATLASAGAPGCRYFSLPTGVTGIQVCDKALCGTTGVCVVDKVCVLKPANSPWQAVGSYVHCRNKQVTLSPPSLSVGTSSVDMSRQCSSDPTIIALRQMTVDWTSTVWPSALDRLCVDLDPTCMTRLVLSNVMIPATPINLPPSVTYMYVDIDLNIESNCFDDIDVESPSMTELTQFNTPLQSLYDSPSILSKWFHCHDRDLVKNPKLRKFANLYANTTINILNITITSWVMDSATYKKFNSLWGGRYGCYGGGYDCYNSTIESDPTECTKLVWYDNKTYTNAVFTVCVVANSGTTPATTSALTTATTRTTQPASTASNSETDQQISTASTNIPSTTSPATNSPEPTGTGISTGAVVGITAARLAVIGLVLWLCCVRQKLQHTPGMTPMLLPNETNERVVTNAIHWVVGHARSQVLCRIQDKDIQLDHVIGSGAFADVWTGTYEGELVAIKQLQAKKVTMHQLQSFVDEIHLMSTFNSPYIVQFIGAAWKQPKDMKCVMELMDGGDLRDYLAKHNPKTFPWSEKMVHIQRIAEALVYLHSLSVIHRDLKSRNVLLDSTKGTKLTDFGVSKEDMEATMTMGVGTFRWMAPEVIKSH